MNKSSKNASPAPPRWAERLLEWLAADHLLEEVQGDLQELFEKRLQHYSLRKARWLYVLDLLKLIHPRLWRNKPSLYPLLNPTDMLQHFLLLSFRSFKRFKGSFFINIIGLSTALTSVLLIYLWVYNELSIDKFHQNDSRLFQVMSQTNTDPAQVHVFESNPVLLAPALMKEMPGVEHALSVRMPTEGIVSLEEKKLKVAARFAGKDFFQVFSFPLIEGDKDLVLQDKHAVVLSTELALKLYGTSRNLIGKTIQWEEETYGGTYVISGVFDNLKAKSSEHYDFLLTEEVFIEKSKMDLHWDNGVVNVYLVLKEGIDAKEFSGQLNRFYRSKVEPMYQQNPEWIATKFLRPYSDKYLYNHYENGLQAGGRIEYVHLFSLIGFFILLIACINFMNLSTAKAGRRLKEIGIKKTIGARRNTLVLQYLSESVLLTLVALGLSLLMAFLLLPQFNFITGKQLTFSWDWKLLSGALIIALLTGLFSGSYPAFYLSGFKPVEVLKGKIAGSLHELWVRKGLVIFQFTLSIVFIVAVIVIYQQIEFVQSKNLGFTKDHILTFKKEGNLHTHLDAFLEEVKTISGVAGASLMGYSMGRPNGSTGGLDWKGKMERIEFTNLEVGYELTELLNIPIREGRSFSKEFGKEDSKIILNELAVESMGLSSPVGEIVKLWGKDYEVIGVVKDFHVESLYEEIKPAFLRLVPDHGNIVVKIEAGRERETIASLGKLYHSYNPGLAFDYTFLDEQYQALYLAEQKVATLSKYFAGMAIVISCLGLFGLAAFTAERRRKEIGIRKVLGSGVWSIVRLLSGEFMQMVLIAIFIAIPLSVLIAKQWLNEFAFNIDLQWWFFAGAGLAALLVAALTVAIQTLKAARINPVHTLRNE